MIYSLRCLQNLKKNFFNLFLKLSVEVVKKSSNIHA